MTSLPDIPVATYRFQFNRDFTFRQATVLVPYLAALGVSHCYASPYLRARPGSMHGYDIIDHTTLNPEIGTPEDYERFVEELHRHGMGQILDIVPNHMGVMGSDNTWWLDVLENGESSSYADFFDIDWNPIKDELRGKVLVPVLEDQYGKVLESGALRLGFDAERGEFSLFYYQHRFPIDPREYPHILSLQLDGLRERLGGTTDDFQEVQSVATAFGHLPERPGPTPEKTAERNREKEVQKHRLAALCARSPEITHFVEENLLSLNGIAGSPRSFDSLHELIKTQAFRLAQWRVAADEINYRRFFDINDLAALRQENEPVFPATHRFVLELIAQGKINGLRIDHPDGLYDPTGYFVALRSAMQSGAGNQTDGGSHYVVVEKILTGNERLREDWPVHGTTGYEFANLVNGLFVDRAAESKMERIYRAFVGHATDLPDLVYNCKKLILKVSLAGELNVLATALSRIALSDRHTCDFTLNNLRSALAEVIASFPVYRTYASGAQPSSQGRQYIEYAIAAAKRRSHAADPSVFDFVHRVLLVEINGGPPESYKQAIFRFARKFQQVTSAVMAKGLEDTAFYRYNRLVSLNDVGGDPSRFGVSVDDFHHANQERMRDWPASMLATSTHDSKRSEDVRARIDVLSEIPARWRLTLRHWRDWNRSKKRQVDGAPAPSRNDEYLLYQTLVGTWPAQPPQNGEWKKFSERIEQYMLKALREAKQDTSWANPNTEYEVATMEFVRSALKRGKKNRFLADLSEFRKRISRLGMFNSLSQTLLKLTSPGVPDTYQGNELWDFSLVDPDNRRAVDYKHRQDLLRDLQARAHGLFEDGIAQAQSLLETMEDGRIKLFLVWKTLRFRKQQQELFRSGQYLPLTVSGPKSDFLCAFARERAGQLAIVAVPRLCSTLLGDNQQSPVGQEVWGGTTITLPETLVRDQYRNIFTGEIARVDRDEKGLSLVVSSALAHYPVALVHSES